MHKKEFHEKLLRQIRRNESAIFAAGRVNELRGKFIGKSAVIAGAGPSLEMNAALLRGSDCVVFSCDRARDRVRGLGVSSAFTVTADPSPATGSFIAQPGVESEILLASTYASTEIISHQWERVLFYNTAGDDLEYMREVTNVCGGVDFVMGGILVSNFAMLLAEYMGFARIAFVGCDFCSPEPEPDWKGSENYIRIQFEGEAPHHTLKSFLAGLQWLDQYLGNRRSEPEPPLVVNCSESGIMYSDNIPMMKLEEFLK